MSYIRIAKNGIVALGMFFAAASAAQAFDDGDPAKGESVFKKCASCHMVGDGAKNKVGPILNGVFGRAAGTFEDYKYGKSLVAAGEAGLVWNEEEMFAYLADPRKYLRARLEDKKAKSKMSFKLKKEEERKDVIAYIKTFSPDYAGGEGEEATEGTATN